MKNIYNFPRRSGASLAHVAKGRRDYARAEALFVQALEMDREMAEKPGIAEAISEASTVHPTL